MTVFTKLSVVALVGLLAVSTDILFSIRAQTKRSIVLAYYYGFYGDQSQGDWSQSRFTPELGPYRSDNESVIRKHMEWAREAAIDGFIVSWWGPDSSGDRSAKMLFREAEAYGVKLYIMIERVVNRRTGQRWYVNVSFQDPNFEEGLLDTLSYVIDNYVTAYPKTYFEFRGKPLIAFYAFLDSRKHDEEAYANFFRRMKNSIREEKDLSISIFSLNTVDSREFDVLALYNPLTQVSGNPQCPMQGQTYRCKSGVRVASVVPGYDDTLTGRRDSTVISRAEGALYRSQWTNASNFSPDVVLITSFNEWYEGTSIEPSKEWGMLYLQITRESIARTEDAFKIWWVLMVSAAVAVTIFLLCCRLVAGYGRVLHSLLFM